MSDNNATALIEKAEKKAVESMDPANFDFLSALENDTVMPTEKVIVFTNARITAEIIKLSAKLKAYTDEADAIAESETNRQRGEVYAELVEAEQAKAAQNAENLDDSDDMVASIIDEPEVVEPMKSASQLLAEAAALVPAVEPVRRPEADELEEQIQALSHQHFAHRMEIELVGISPTVQLAYTEEVEAEMRLPLQAKLSPEEANLYQQERLVAELVAHSIVEVYDAKADKRTDFREHRMPAGAARRLLRALILSERKKLTDVATMLTYAAVLIDMKTDAGFPGGRSEPEGESVLDAVL